MSFVFKARKWRSSEERGLAIRISMLARLWAPGEFDFKHFGICSVRLIKGVLFFFLGFV